MIHGKCELLNNRGKSVFTLIKTIMKIQKLSLSLLALIVSAGAGAYDFSEVETTYGTELFFTVNDDGQSVSLVQGPDPYNASIIHIPSNIEHNGKSYKVTAIAPEAFANNKNISYIELSENLETIGGKAFYYSNINTIANLPTSLRSIGKNAFENSNLSSINKIDYNNYLNEGLEFIGQRAFYNSKLNNITIPNSVTIIDEGAFAYSPLTEVHLGTGIKQIKDDTFRGCQYLSSIDLPEGIESIGSGAFRCTNYGESVLQDVHFPSTLKIIGSEAFRGTMLSAVVLPEDVQTIGKSAFQSCDLLESFVFSKALTEIPDYCLRGCKKLHDVTIYEGITKIGEWAFYECSSLSSIKFPDSVKEVGEYVLASTAISTFNFPSNLSYVGEWMFYGCKNIINFNIPSTINEIKESAFRGCENMETIHIAESVTKIGEYVFFGCSALDNVVLPAEIEVIRANCFYDCSYLHHITLPANLKTIERYCFRGCSSLSSIDIPKSLEQILEFAFQDCSALEKVTLPSTLKRLDDESFKGCSMLTEMHLNRAIPPAVRGAHSDGSMADGIAGKDNVCVLYVPTGSKAEYDALSETTFRNFKDIVEEDVDGTVYYQLSFKSDGNGSFQVNGENVSSTYVIAMKNDAAITVVPKKNYHLATLKVDGRDRTVEVVDNMFFLENVLENYTIEATFDADPVMLYVQTGNGGQVGVNVVRGETHTCTISVESGWQVSTVLFNGSNVTSKVVDGKYTTPKLTDDALLIVTFEQSSDPSRVLDIADDGGMKAYATPDGYLHISGTEKGERVEVVTADGKRVTTFVSDGHPKQLLLHTHGIYIVNSSLKNIKLSY